MITPRILITAGQLLVLLVAAEVASAQSVELLPNGSRDVVLTRLPDAYEIRTTGTDPYLKGTLSRIDASNRIFEIEYFAVEGVKGIELFLGPPVTPKNRMRLPPMEAVETWAKYRVEIDARLFRGLPRRNVILRLDLGRQAGVNVQIRSARFVPETPADRQAKLAARQVASERETRRARVSDYLKAGYPTRIETVSIGSDTIELSGRPFPESIAGADVQVVEVPPWIGVDEDSIGRRIDSRLSSDGQVWKVKIPRFVDSYDRLHSSWRLVVQGKPITGRRYATRIQTRGSNHAPERLMPANQKGLGGVDRNRPLAELPELGVTAITLNILLNAFVTGTPGPGRVRIPIRTETLSGDGKSVDLPPVYFNPVGFQRIDSVVAFARKHEIVVSGILLIPSRIRDEVTAMIVHPDNDGGTYSMPNLTDAVGAQIYAYLLDRLGRRYTNPATAPGEITNWIVHNEVDMHTAWTNMGKQPRALVTEMYYRSMRMVSNAVRQYNPHARVFVSLTHHWVVRDDGKGTRLAPRDVLGTLQRYSILEGDFPWGVAYHPYPQSLFAATAWNDTRVTEELDSPFITIQNIEVLEAFLKHNFMRDASREVRPILLSEQGFHSADYGDVAQANQAGSLAYAMRKIKPISAIESFHYHRWVDHPTEGGLKMGLRTLPSPGNPHGEKKRAWHVYRAIGTAEEGSATRDLPGANLPTPR